ncbi:hypothetical protein [Streptomyces sp. NPDC006309]|uniref:hypothetical protein n=1 Tax=Streptomyces sp. NPDC006309 TaxID=3156749 RepID=UPI0033A5DEE0
MNRLTGKLVTVAAGFALALAPVQAHAAPSFPDGCKSTTGTSSSGNWSVTVTACLGKKDAYNHNSGSYRDHPATWVKVDCQHYSGGFWSTRRCQVEGSAHLDKDGQQLQSGSIGFTTSPFGTGETSIWRLYECRGHGTYSYTAEGLSATELISTDLGVVTGETASVPAVTVTATGC